jgi:predicted anti-sigma-YlaC factor YlaD
MMTGAMAVTAGVVMAVMVVATGMMMMTGAMVAMMVVAASTAPVVARTRWIAVVLAPVVTLPTPGMQTFTVTGRSGQESVGPAPTELIP